MLIEIKEECVWQQMYLLFMRSSVFKLKIPTSIIHIMLQCISKLLPYFHRSIEVQCPETELIRMNSVSPSAWLLICEGYHTALLFLLRISNFLLFLFPAHKLLIDYVLMWQPTFWLNTVFPNKVTRIMRLLCFYNFLIFLNQFIFSHNR